MWVSKQCFGDGRDGIGKEGKKGRGENGGVVLDVERGGREGSLKRKGFVNTENEKIKKKKKKN